MLELLGMGPRLFIDTCIATETPDDLPVYRKPSPRFIVESVAKHGLDRTQSWMVGDKSIDVQAGLNAAINAAFVGVENLPFPQTVLRSESLHAFARAVCA
jgi:D-glycero-D-manno-heptose 1,7-bisphosphate phosphatase